MILRSRTGEVIGTVSQAPAQNNSSLAVALGQAMQANNQGVYRMDIPKTNPLQFPKSTAFSAVNTNAAESGTIKVYVFNEDTYNSTAIGAAALVSKSYNDGFAGKGINQMLKVANGANGLKCIGFNIMFKDAAGNQDSAALETAEFTIQSYNGIGGASKPEVIDLTEALRNNAFQQGLLTIDCEFDVAALTQCSFMLPKGYSASVNFKWARVF